MSDKVKKAALSEEKATKKEKKANAADSGKSKKEKEKKSVFKRIAAWFKDLKKEFKGCMAYQKVRIQQHPRGFVRCNCRQRCNRSVGSGLPEPDAIPDGTF